MKIKNINSTLFKEQKRIDLYTALFIAKGEGTCLIDAGEYSFKGPAIIFISPFQKIKINSKDKILMKMLEFHGDFYCIEFHKPEVACNGLLFNNIFLSPVLGLSEIETLKINDLFEDISLELNEAEVDQSVMVSYLQLFLALTSRLKKKKEGFKNQAVVDNKEMERFKDLIDKHFLTKRKPADYAKILNLTSNTLTKKSKKYFTKNPSELISERLILEAKKELHLTRKSIKEVAFTLLFEDEHYFSRFFKKEVGLSPLAFRKSAGISKVADLST